MGRLVTWCPRRTCGESDRKRAYVAVLAGMIAWAAYSGTLVPLLFVGLPSFYGAWLVVFFGITQHAGLCEDVLDHRLNTRTVYLNPVFRFLYLNMNYHLEHHLFPAVPYYNLPQLHEEIKAYLPPPKPSIFAAYREIAHALRMQRRDITWELPHPYPPDGPFSPEDQQAREAQEAGPLAWQGERHRNDTAAVAAGEIVATGRTDLGPVGAMTVGEVRRIDLGGRTSHFIGWMRANSH